LRDLAALVPDVRGDRRKFEILGHRVIVEADQRHISGYPQAHAPQCSKSTESHLVTFRKYGGGQAAATE
jgi:hypothetical protein